MKENSNYRATPYKQKTWGKWEGKTPLPQEETSQNPHGSGSHLL